MAADQTPAQSRRAECAEIKAGRDCSVHGDAGPQPVERWWRIEGEESSDWTDSADEARAARGHGFDVFGPFVHEAWSKSPYGAVEVGYDRL